jgi:trehalose-6-phosphate synthase
MARVVVVSNRLADPRKAAAGGLAVALGETLSATGGLWFGWSGKVVEDGTPGEGELHLQQAGNVTLATVDLCREDHDTYYLGYANRVLWPMFHYRLDLADFNKQSLDGYRRVNRMFARKLMPLLQPDDLIWIHDYHLIPLAAELRSMGCGNRIGFFLHIPLPPPLLLAALPGHEWLIRALFAYDLVGFQAKADVDHFERYVQAEACRAARRRALPRLQPHGAGARLPDRHRRRRVLPARAGQGSARDLRDHARAVLEATPADRHRPARLLQGPAAAHPRLPGAAGQLPGEPAQRDADPDRLADARERRRLRRHPA